MNHLLKSLSASLFASSLALAVFAVSATEAMARNAPICAKSRDDSVDPPVWSCPSDGICTAPEACSKLTTYTEGGYPLYWTCECQ